MPIQSVHNPKAIMVIIARVGMVMVIVVTVNNLKRTNAIDTQ